MKIYIKQICIIISAAMLLVACGDDDTTDGTGCQIDADECQVFCEENNLGVLDEYPWGAINSTFDNSTCICECKVSHCDNKACAKWCKKTKDLDNSYCYFNECKCEDPKTDAGLSSFLLKSLKK